MSTRVPVLEVMSKSPVTITRDDTVRDAAILMKEKDVSALVVVEGKKVVGIITENDLVHKVIVPDKSSSRTRVGDVMTSQVISVHQDEEVVEAARKMSQKGIRRLVVTDDSDLKGVVTENDILRIWPGLIEVTREYQRIGITELEQGKESGYCESCSVFSSSLLQIGGQLLCPECRER